MAPSASKSVAQWRARKTWVVEQGSRPRRPWSRSFGGLDLPGPNLWHALPNMRIRHPIRFPPWGRARHIVPLQ
eukprot:4376226-Lingulodinium_polyedra.AAC.1